MAQAALSALGVEGRALVVLRRDEADHHAIWKSFRNLRSVHVIDIGELNAYDVLVNDWIVFSKPTLDATVARLGAADADSSGTSRAVR